MSIIDRIFVGKVIKDFGPIRQKSIGIARITDSALLTERRGKLYFVLKSSAWGLLGAGVRYRELSLHDACRLRELINESEQIARSQPPSTYDPKDEFNRNSLIVALIGLVIVALAQSRDWIIAITLIMLALFAFQYWEFQRFPEIVSHIRRRLAMLAGFTVIAVALKIALPVLLK